MEQEMMLFELKYGVIRLVDQNGRVTLHYDKRDSRHPNYEQFKAEIMAKYANKEDNGKEK